MNQATTLVNSRQIQKLTGITRSNLKYHRLSGHIQAYHLEGQKQWFYKADRVNKLFIENISNKSTRQNVPQLAIVNTSISFEGGNTANK